MIFPLNLHFLWDFPWFSIYMTDSHHPSICALLAVSKWSKWLWCSSRPWPPRTAQPRFQTTAWHILQAQVIENALETWKYEVHILKYPQITILETRFLASFEKGSGNTGEPCARWKKLLYKDLLHLQSSKFISVPMETPALIRWFYKIFTWFSH